MIIQYSRYMYLGWLRHPLTFWSVSFQRFQYYSSIIIIFNLTNKINILISQMRLKNLFYGEVRKKEKSIFRLTSLAQVWSRKLKSSIALCSRLHLTISFQSIKCRTIMFQYYNNHLYLSGQLVPSGLLING